MKTKKLLKKVFLYILATMLGFLSLMVISTYIYKDELIEHFIQEANKNLKTPVKVGKIEVSAWDKFPMVSLTFSKVSIQESLPKSTDHLLKAEKIYFTFNPLSLIKGDYSIRQIHLEDAEAFLKIDRFGRVNYEIVQNEIAQQDGTQKIHFNLKKVKLKNTRFTYQNEVLEQFIAVHAHDLQASLKGKGQKYQVQARGKLTSQSLRLKGTDYLKDKPLNIDTQLTYDANKSTIDLRPSSLKLKGSEFLVYGGYSFKKINTISLFVEGQATDIQTLLSLLPSSTAKPWQAYESRGEVYFDMELAGAISQHQSPELKVNFGFRNATLLHPETKARIKKANLEGSFEAKSLRNLETARLSLKNVVGTLEGRPFQANFSLQNFKNHYIQLDFKGSADVASLLKFYPVEEIQSATGSIDMDLSLKGYLKDLKHKSTAQRVDTNGEVVIKGLDIDMGNRDLAISQLSGSLIFNKSDLAISDVSGKLGRSDFLLNGFFVNIITYLLFENQPLSIEADLKSRFIDLDALLSEKFHPESKEKEEGEEQNYSLRIPKNLFLSFDCDVDKLQFRRFAPTKIKGQLKVQKQLAALKGASFQALGGKVKLNSIIDTRDLNHISSSSDLALHRIDVDSIFYVFENFNQDFLVDKNLRGQIYAGIRASMAFDENLSLKDRSLTADISTSIKNGELNDFKPLQMLSKYVDQDNLDRLRFSDLSNDIRIANDTIYLPEMEVRSNVSNITVSGIHTFDQHIHYRVAAPIRNKARYDKDASFGAIEEDEAGRSKIHLKILGTAKDYEIIYDTKSVKKKIIKDLKKEAKELKDAFKNRGKEAEKEKELEEDDYFNWDDDQ